MGSEAVERYQVDTEPGNIQATQNAKQAIDSASTNCFTSFYLMYNAKEATNGERGVFSPWNVNPSSFASLQNVRPLCYFYWLTVHCHFYHIIMLGGCWLGCHPSLSLQHRSEGLLGQRSQPLQGSQPLHPFLLENTLYNCRTIVKLLKDCVLYPSLMAPPDRPQKHTASWHDYGHDHVRLLTKLLPQTTSNLQNFPLNIALRYSRPLFQEDNAFPNNSSLCISLCAT